MRAIGRLFPLFLAAACGDGGPGPEDVARRYYEARIRGDAQLLLTMLTSRDIAVVERYLGTDTLPVLIAAAGEPGSEIDSVRVVSQGGDTAVVNVHLTAPNWEWGTTPPTSDTAVVPSPAPRDPARAATLPRIHGAEAVALRRESGAWKVHLDLEGAVEVSRHYLPLHDETVPLAQRAKHAEALLAVSSPVHQPSRMLRANIRSMLAGMRIADSLQIEFERLADLVPFTKVVVANPTATPIRSLKIRAKGADGRLDEAWVGSVPARGRGDGYTQSRLALPVQEARIIQIEAGEP